MIKKKYLFPNDVFYEEDPHLIASLIGPGFLCVTVFNTAAKKGGMAVFPASTVECETLLENDTEYPLLDRCIQAVLNGENDGSVLDIHLFGSEYDETALRPGQLEFTMNSISGKLKTSVKAGSVTTEVKQFPGIRIYFKNWDNTLRVTEAPFPAYCLGENKPAGSDTIRLLIVDDSSLVQNILLRTLKQDEQIEIIGTASDVFAATEMILEKDPDVILLDIIMPQINGLNYLQELMQHNPIPVVVFSTLGKNGGNVQKQALEFGAVDVMDKRQLNLSDRNSIEVIQNKLKKAVNVTAAG